jgi:hypothetical protein
VAVGSSGVLKILIKNTAPEELARINAVSGGAVPE